uniref:Ephrin RBD domain-containing protein n=1 Tax=Acrobeloides nanus TaxID=290746 RepID=A0A914EAM7_9BILA
MLRKLIPVPSITFCCVRRFTQCSFSIYILYLFLATACSAPFAETVDVEIDWSPESSLFNKGSLTTTKFVRIGDKVVFHCPPNLWLSIHRVNRQSLFHCDLSHTSDTLVGYCKPDQNRFTFVVRDFSLLPNAPIFKPNEYYYFT